MRPPSVLLVCDAGAEIGGGHVMRSLTLARALSGRGAACRMLAPASGVAIARTFAAGLAIGLAEGPDDPAALAAFAARREADVVVFDHFRLGAAEQALGASGRAAAAVDDLADRPMAVALVIDPGPDRRTADYAGLVGHETRLLLGPEHALVRPEFAEARQAGPGRPAAGPVRRVLVSLGLTDVGGISGRVVGRLLPRLGEATADVVLGPLAPSRAGLERLAARDSRVRLHAEVRDMAAMMAAADLAVGAGGSSTWERCVLGLPTLALVLAPNQAPSMAALARRGAAEVVDAGAADFEAAFDRAFAGLMASGDRRAALARRSAGLCDGLGAGRVAEAVLGLLRRPG